MDEHAHSQRPFSAPSMSLYSFSHPTNLNPKMLISKDEQLCAWSNSTAKANQPKRSSNDKKSRQSKTAVTLTSTSTKHSLASNPRKSNSNLNLTKTKSNKWYLRTAKDSQLDFKYPFQHHTDTSKYITDYRTSKMAKIHDVYSEDIQSVSVPEVCVYEPILKSTNNTSSLHNANVFMHSTIETEEFPLCYRLDGRKNTKESKRLQQESPIKVRGKCVDNAEDKKKEGEQLNRKYTNYLPKCDAVIISHRTTGERSTISSASQDTFLPTQTLQSKKINELSIEKAPQRTLPRQYILQDHTAWTPHNKLPPREKIKLRSAEERRRRTPVRVSTSPSKTTGYSLIIKRVLEHYDPSQNQVRARMTSLTLSPKGLMATT